ncbi:MAG: stalk domain-containing protein [Candidatus Cryosericum sp.]
MKRIVLFGTIAVLVLALASVAYASSGSKNILVTFRNIKIIINGETKSSAQEPFIVGGSTYVPLRFISESVGMSVNWDGPTNTIDIEPLPNNVMVKSEPVPGAEITVEQYPGPVVVVKTKMCQTDANGDFSITFSKDELASMPDQTDFLLTIKVKDSMGYALEDGASNKIAVRILKAKGPVYKFTLLWRQNTTQLKTNKGTFAVNGKTQS